jgi:hypothetical protein
VEGGVWQSGLGSLAYAYPTYEGTGQKTDLPQAEEPTIRHVAEPRPRRGARSNGSGIRARKYF